MTVQSMLELLILLPREMEVVMEDLEGDILTICCVKSAVEEIDIDEDEKGEIIYEDALVLKVCTCSPDEPIEIPVVPDKNQNFN